MLSQESTKEALPVARRADPSRTPQLRFEARCAWCGSVRLSADQLVVHAKSRVEALFEFTCPECDRVNTRALEAGDLAILVRAGMSISPGPGPFELLEHASGPPIGWDDIIDFHEAMSRSEGLPDEAGAAATSGDSSRPERDAA